MRSYAKFRPAWWLRGPHGQTLWRTLCPPKARLALERERLSLPDGDFLDLDWVPDHRSGPLVLVLHGLEGGSCSPYVQSLLRCLTDAGLGAVVMHFRGCSGEPNRLLRRYHAGETADVAEVVRHLLHEQPGRPLYAIGYSLGGNMLLKWLGETGPANPLAGAAAISVPFRLDHVAERLNRGVSRVYRRHLLRRLIRSNVHKTGMPGFPVDLRTLQHLPTLRSFDDAVTAPLHGFASADDYYRRCSCHGYLKHIRVPTLIVHALDDPFMTRHSAPTAHELSDSIELDVSPRGGHVGFVEGGWPWRPRYWLERRLLAWIECRIKGGNQTSTISKSDLVAPQSGQAQLSGTSSHRVPGAIPSSGRPFSSS